MMTNSSLDLAQGLGAKLERKENVATDRALTMSTALNELEEELKNGSRLWAHEDAWQEEKNIHSLSTSNRIGGVRIGKVTIPLNYLIFMCFSSLIL